ncbi:MAG: hypothetical protein SCM96_12110 [Acidobacteriota bacterium]|nr:hypothetical protein [Acidobacteriota bacterium]
MKKTAWFGFAAAAVLAAGAVGGQDISHVVKVVNIEVPVRVFQGDVFVDNLGIEDFELIEDGRIQDISGVVLVKKTSVLREEGRTPDPRVSRTFVFLFQLSDYFPEIAKAVDHFLTDIFLPGDTLIVITPLRSYSLKGDALEKMSRDAVRDRLMSILRTDVAIGGTEYKNIMRELHSLLSGGITEESLTYYEETLNRLETLRVVDQAKMIEFARFLKDREGSKHVFLFYQKEEIPKLHPRVLSETMDMSLDQMSFVFTLMDRFDFYRRELNVNVEEIMKAFSDSSLSAHFLFLTRTPAQQMDITERRPSGLIMVEQSEDIYSAFREIAGATGGLTTASSDPAAAFRRAADAAESYYLLFYSPRDYKADGGFRRIQVKVKTGSFTIRHRAGYFAD